MSALPQGWGRGQAVGEPAAPTQPVVVRDRLSPNVRKSQDVVARRRADACEEHHQLELEEDDRVNARTTPLGITLPRPLADETQVELGLQVAVEVVRRYQRL